MALSRWLERRESGAYAVTPSSLTIREKKKAIRELAGALNKSVVLLEEKGLENASPFYRKYRGLIEDESPLMGRSVKGKPIFSQSVGDLTERELNTRFARLRDMAGMKTRHYSKLAEIYPDFVSKRVDSKGRVTYETNEPLIGFYRQLAESTMYHKFAEIYGSENAIDFYEDGESRGLTREEIDALLAGRNPWTGKIVGSSLDDYSRRNPIEIDFWKRRLLNWHKPDISEAAREEQEAFSNEIEEFV